VSVDTAKDIVQISENIDIHYAAGLYQTHQDSGGISACAISKISVM